MSKYLENRDPGYLPHNRSEIQGTVQILFAENALTLEDYYTKGALDLGCFTGGEIKSEAKSTDVKKANRGITTTTAKLGSDITVGLELTSKEVADKRKAQIAFFAKEMAGLTQAAIAAATAVDLPAFAAGSPAVLNNAYQILKDGKPVREIIAFTLKVGVNDLEEGVDYVIDKKLGMVRFIKTATLPAAAVTATASAKAITETDETFMHGLQAMTKPRFRGYARFLVWDSDPGSNLVMEFEPRPVEIIAAGGFKIDADNQSEIKLTVSFTSTKERILLRS